MINFQTFSVPELKYAELQLERNYAYDMAEKWESFRPKINKILKFINRPITSRFNRADEDYALVYEIEKGAGVVILDISRKYIAVSISANNVEVIDNHLNLLKTFYPPVPDSVDGKVKVRFWYNTNHGPRSVVRSISVPNWKTIKHNYDPETLIGLNYLIDEFKPTSGGQLLIMNGHPGTGKSYFLRSLLHSWRDWCTAEYVLDPENLFSGGQGYMADLVLKNSYDEDSGWEVEEESSENDKWKLLILEDSGDLLKDNAKDYVGPGLARLLNLVDGLIGQGLRVLVLITTNEEFRAFHQAVVRDGRCAAKITFNELKREQAESWLNGNANKLPNGKEKFTLSELYALTKGKTVKQLEKESRGFGFKMP